MKESGSDAVAELVAELSELARVRNRLELSVDRFPALGSNAAEPTMESIFESIDEAMAGLDQRTQLAAAALLADTPERWDQNLKTRSTAAATHLGIGSYHTFRDRRSGESPSDQLLAGVAKELLKRSGETPLAELGPPLFSSNGSFSSDVTSDDGGALAGRVGLLAAAGVALLAFVALVLVRDGDAVVAPAPEPVDVVGTTTPTSAVSIATEQQGTIGASEALPVEGCDIPLGGSVTPTPEQGAVAASIAGAVDAVDGIDMTGCPLHSIERWQNLWVQAFTGDELPPGSVLVDDAGNGLWVEEGVVIGYRNGMSGTLQQISGLPVAFRAEGLTQLLELGDGSFVVAEVPGNRAFWIAAEAADDWLTAGGAIDGLGPPMTDPNFIEGRPEQHFRNGRIWEGSPGEAIVELVDPADIEAYLLPLDNPRERLVRTFDSTAWWIDASGVRRWIPDGATWNCVGGADVVLEEETPGWIIGSFPVGPPMSCDA